MMTRTTSFFCVLLFLSLPTHAQETKPLGSIDLDLSRLKTRTLTKMLIHLTQVAPRGCGYEGGWTGFGFTICLYEVGSMATAC